MTIKFRKIGNPTYVVLSYSNNVIKNLHQFSGYDFEFEPTIPNNYLHVTIEKYPDSLDLGGGWRPAANIFTEYNGEYSQMALQFGENYCLFTTTSQFFTFFNLYGRYVISFKEYAEDDTLYSTNIMYFEVYDLKRDMITFPFSGEGYEFDTDGWSSSINKSLISLNGQGDSDVRLCASLETYLSVGDVCEVISTTLDQNDIIYVIQSPDEGVSKNAYGIILNIFDDCFMWNNEAGAVVPVSLYRVGFKGSFIADELSFSSSTIYFDNNTKELSDDDSYTYVGKWDETNKIIIIENEIVGYNTNIDMSAYEGSIIVKGSEDWEELPAGEENEVLQIKSGVPSWSTPNFLYDVFKNNSGESISKGVCVQFGGIYDASVRFIDENDISSYALSNGAISITPDSLDNDKATIKQYKKTGGTLGQGSETTATTVRPSTTNKNAIFKSYDNSSLVWQFFVYDRAGVNVFACKKLDPYQHPELGAVADLIDGVSTTGTEFMFDFHYIDGDCGLLVTSDSVNKEMNVYFLNKTGAKTLISTISSADLPENLYSINMIKITKHDNMFIVYFDYVTYDDPYYYTGLKCFTVNNVNWLDITLTDVNYEDMVDVVPLTISNVPSATTAVIYDVTENRDDTDIVAFYTPSVATSKIYLQTVIIRDKTYAIVDIDTLSLFDTGITNCDILFAKSISINKMKENLAILSYISSTSGKYETYIVYVSNDYSDSYTLSDESYHPPVVDLIDSVNYTLTGLFSVEVLSEDQFALVYTLKKTSDTYSNVRIALGTLIKDSSIFWQEMIAPVKWESYHNRVCKTCFSIPSITKGMLFVNSYNSNNSSYISYYEYLPEIVNNIIGISQEAIAHDSTGVVGISGVVEVAASSVIPRVNYYCDDEGEITSIPTKNYIGQAINTGKILFTPKMGI